jgi:hypothetical protein
MCLSMFLISCEIFPFANEEIEKKFGFFFLVLIWLLLLNFWLKFDIKRKKNIGAFQIQLKNV